MRLGGSATGNKRVMSFINSYHYRVLGVSFLITNASRACGAVSAAMRDGVVDGLEELGRAMRASTHFPRKARG
jgi:hypothetical protein